MHRGTWFRMQDCTAKLVVAKGGRQGCKFGCVMFNMCYAMALKSIAKLVSEQGLDLKLRYSAGMFQAMDAEPKQIARILEATFVDDEALVLVCKPQALHAKLSSLMSIVRKTFTTFGMLVNWKPGKTEYMVTWRGPGANKEQERVPHVMNGNGILLRDKRRRCKHKTAVVADTVMLRVDQYKHLGSIISADRKLTAESKHREQAANTAYVSIQSKLLGSRWLCTEKKKMLVQSLVVSRLCLNVHTWPEFAGKPRRRLNAMYMKCWRRIVGDPQYRRTKYSDLQVRTLLQVVSIDCLIRQRRLLYFARVARAGIEPLIALLQQRAKDGSRLPWVALLIDDLQILKAFHTKLLDELPCPQHDTNAWWEMAKNYPREWKCLVRKYKTYEDDRVSSFAKRKWREGARDDNQMHEEMVCPECDQAFLDNWRLQSHRWKKHGVKSELRKYIGDHSDCPVCGVDFITRPRLIRHLSETRLRSKKRAKTCRDEFLNSHPLPIDQAVYDQLERRDADVLKKARAAGHGFEIATIRAKKAKSCVASVAT
mmetsp:Transcript_132726/g.264871  ORF Transcript_132726/g.264871 Transcript_132726/m.264871 type:complete len:539 (+) Transcript_132726:2-1618(+)